MVREQSWNQGRGGGGQVQKEYMFQGCSVQSHVGEVWTFEEKVFPYPVKLFFFFVNLREIFKEEVTFKLTSQDFYNTEFILYISRAKDFVLFPAS